METPTRHLLTSSEAADVVRLTPRQIDRLARRGELPSVHLPGAELRYDVDDLWRWVDYDIALHVVRGYISTTYAHSIAEQWRAIEKPIFAYYMGDWDPSGLDIERDLIDKLERYSGRTALTSLGLPYEMSSMLSGHPVPWDECDECDDQSFQWQRLGLLLSDFEDFDLMPLKAKTGDKRTEQFVAKYGDRCAELDAVPPGVLRGRISDAVNEHIDAEEWGRLQVVEQEERESFTKFMDQLRV